jgi:sugar transferase (PEP-CTERM system associated)
LVRLFNVYYPTRVLVLVATEVLVVCASFVLAAVLQLGRDSMLVLNYENGFLKILGITAVAILIMHYFDLYDLQRVPSKGEARFRMLVVLGILSFLLAGIIYLFPGFTIGNQTLIVGLVILTIALFAWRSAYEWLIRLPILRERVYVLGEGSRAKWLVETMRARPHLGMQVIGWGGGLANGPQSREVLGNRLLEDVGNQRVDRVIVALDDRRGTMPVRELLNLRLKGVNIEDASAITEKISGKIEVDALSPSGLIFAKGFRLNPTFLFLRRLISLSASVGCLLVISPLLPLIALLIKLTSAGPIIFRQRRVGKNGQVFTCYKFRTMRADAEMLGEAKWAGDDDPRITSVGRLLRRTRMDEIPQLWNVFKGEMGFVGPRPERPEFVEWLSREIPYYHLRHVIRPGVTGWAQIRYRYGASLEESKEKLKYDLYYIKQMSLSFDIMIILESAKIVMLQRGAR